MALAPIEPLAKSSPNWVCCGAPLGLGRTAPQANKIKLRHRFRPGLRVKEFPQLYVWWEHLESISSTRGLWGARWVGRWRPWSGHPELSLHGHATAGPVTVGDNVNGKSISVHGATQPAVKISINGSRSYSGDHCRTRTIVAHADRIRRGCRQISGIERRRPRGRVHVNGSTHRPHRMEHAWASRTCNHHP